MYRRNQPQNGYLKSDTIYPANLEYRSSTTPVVELKITDFFNDEPTGEISIKKTDKKTGNKRFDGTYLHGDATIARSVYKLYANEDIYNVSKSLKYFSKDEEIASFTYDEKGNATVNITNTDTSAKLSVEGTVLKGLPVGSYYSMESEAGKGYNLDKEKQIITINYEDSETKTIKVDTKEENDVERAPFEVIKISSNENKTAETIEGAEFTAILTRYVKYYGGFNEALKHIDEFANDEYSIFKTNDKGHGISKRLAYGNYTVNETYTPSNQINTVEEFYVTIDQDLETPLKEVVENDTPFESYIKIEKKDKKTGKLITYSHATFSLYKLNEKSGKWEKVECKVGNKYYNSWTTDENGVAHTETKLKAGHYKIDEIVVPDNFIKIDEELTFDVNNENKTVKYDEDWDAWITVIAVNEQTTATLIIDKSIAIREDIDTSLVDVSDLSKIKFRLTAKEDIIDYVDGSVIYSAGTEIGTYNLDKKGNLKVENLPMGKYELEEIETLDGLVLDTTKHEIEFKQEDKSTKVYKQTKKIENDTTVVEFSKTDITGDKELPGAELTVSDENGEIIDSWTSTENTHKIEGLKVGETYILREEIAPDGYVKATEIKFTVENTSEIQKIQMIDKIVEMTKTDIGGNEVEGAELKVVDKDGNIVDSWISEKENHKIKGLVEGETYTLYEDYAPDGFVIANSIEFTVTEDKETQKIQMIDKQLFALKTDVDGNPLEGATLTVTSMKTKNIVDKWISEKTPHAVSGLIENEAYILHEEKVVDGYVKAKDIEFIVTPEKEIQEITMIDKIVSVVKTDFVTGEELPGAEIEIMDMEYNTIDKWTSTNEPHNVIGLEEGREYILTETICPYGFNYVESIIFTVSEDKQNQLIEMKDMPILTSIKVIKIDSETKESIKDKFTFGLYLDKECTQLIQQVDANKKQGTVTFEDIRYGTFYIKELSAPKNYQLSDKIVEIKIDENGVFADGEEMTQDENLIYEFKFENTKIPEVNTGSILSNTIIFTIIGISIIAIVVGIILLKKKH